MLEPDEVAAMSTVASSGWGTRRSAQEFARPIIQCRYNTAAAHALLDRGSGRRLGRASRYLPGGCPEAGGKGVPAL